MNLLIKLLDECVSARVLGLGGWQRGTDHDCYIQTLQICNAIVDGFLKVFAFHFIVSSPLRRVNIRYIESEHADFSNILYNVSTFTYLFFILICIIFFYVLYIGNKRCYTGQWIHKDYIAVCARCTCPSRSWEVFLEPTWD